MSETLQDNSEKEKSNNGYKQLSDMADEFDKAKAEEEKAEKKEELAKNQNKEKPFDPDSISPREAVGALYRTQTSKEYEPVETMEDAFKKMNPNPIVREYKIVNHELKKRKEQKAIENSMSLDYAVKKMKKHRLKSLYNRIMLKFK